MQRRQLKRIISVATLVVVLSISVFYGIRLLSHSSAASFDVASYLTLFTPGTAHEAKPHGVPTGDDWASTAVLHRIAPPDSSTTYINFWGQLYVGLNDVRPANTRVAVSDCQQWALPNGSSTWTLLQDNTPASFNGAGWKEDFSANGGPFSMVTESDGSASFITYEGYNAHFFTKHALINTGSSYRAYVDSCSTRLVLANASGTDDRAQSSYVLSIGTDWKHSDGSCPTQNGHTVCQSMGVGKFIKVTNSWRRLVFSTMSSADLASMPAPPLSSFKNPDGSYGTGSVVTPPPPPANNAAVNAEPEAGIPSGKAGVTSDNTASRSKAVNFSL